MSTAQRVVNVIREAIDQQTENGASFRYAYATVATGGSAYMISAYISGNEAVSDYISQSAGGYVRTGDYITVGISDNDSWVERVHPTSAYAKLAIDFNAAKMYTGDGATPPVNEYLPITMSGVITPTALSADTDNWNPTGLSSARVIRASATGASRNLTGIVPPFGNGEEVRIWNVGSQNIVMIHDATSTTTNRFLIAGSANYTMTPNSGARLWYDITSTRWRVSTA